MRNTHNSVAEDAHDFRPFQRIQYFVLGALLQHRTFISSCFLGRTLVLAQHFLLAAIPGNVVDARVLYRDQDVLGQDALDLCRVHAGDVALEALVPCDPAAVRVGDADEALENLRGAVVDLLGIAGELQDVFAVGAALGGELLLCADDGADHAGAHVALLVGWDGGAALNHGFEIPVGEEFVVEDGCGMRLAALGRAGDIRVCGRSGTGRSGDFGARAGGFGSRDARKGVEDGAMFLRRAGVC
jgi:hypothetical protein